MNSLVKVFSNFKEFYNEINGATLTGAIDVIVVEQPDGEFQCSPFHVRFGKLGVLRSREKIVDVVINGEPVDIRMKLGDSGEAFFVEECPEDDLETLPENLATSPLPSLCFPKKFEDNTLEDEHEEKKIVNASDDLPLPLPLPRRNSIDLSKETTKEEAVPNFENQVSDFSHRRHTDNVLERRNLNEKLKEYTTQKLRQEWAEHEEIFQFDAVETDKDWLNSTQSAINKDTKQTADTTPTEDDTLIIDDKEMKKEPIITVSEVTTAIPATSEIATAETATAEIATVTAIVTATSTSTPTLAITPTLLSEQNSQSVKDESKGKKKRRKKSLMKKKNAQRKSSSSSSIGSNNPQEICGNNNVIIAQIGNDVDISNLISNTTNSSSNDELSPKSCDPPSAQLLTANTTVGDNDNESPSVELQCPTTPPTQRIPDLDIHFFSDTEVTSSGGNCGVINSRGAGRPSTPIQSDSEVELSMREKEVDANLMKNSALWKWGELPTSELSDNKDCGIGQGSQRNSMLSGMFNFMKITNKIRKQANDGGIYLSDLDGDSIDPEMAALYFPTNTFMQETPVSSILHHNHGADDDRESGNGTSLPHSPSSMEGAKSIDSDYEDGRLQNEKHFDFISMSLCGLPPNGEPTVEEFDKHLIKYTDVCANPNLFASPNLVVRLNGKCYGWAAACPIVMTIITFKKPLTNDAIEKLIVNVKQTTDAVQRAESVGDVGDAVVTNAVGQAKRPWWYWRRPQNAVPSSATIITNNANGKTVKIDEKDGDQTAVATQTTRPNSPDISDNTLSKTDSTLNAENTSAMVENLEDLSQASSHYDTNNKNERYKKSLRLSSDVIKQLNLKEGMNEIEFSVTTAYQGTSRCKCHLYRWRHNDKVVISDIDGTITKSDVLGHILPIIGKDWAQMGVAELFTKIEQNGYKLLYLSARAIGQSRATRDYLRSIRQDNIKLPDGPLLLNPTSLISAFHREVIEKKPEQFKIACLSDIRDLFPDKDPFYAGYGNRINDVWAYCAVGIPLMRIFTINTKGELKHELTQTFQSSGFINQSLEVDEYFPPIPINDYDYNTDNFDDDEEEDELKFSETTDSDDNDNNNNNINNHDDDGDIFSDDYADDGIGIDEEDEFLITESRISNSKDFLELYPKTIDATLNLHI